MRRKFKPNIMIVGLAAMILIITAIAWAQGASQVALSKQDIVNNCSSCHQMEDEVQHWQTSSHKDVACTECHADPGLQGWVHQQLAGIRMKLAADDAQKADSEIEAIVPNQRCLDCHAKEMPFVMQDLKPFERDEKGEPAILDKSKLAHLPAVAGHDLHLTMEKPLNCQDCHKSVSHGPAPDQRATRVEAMHQVCLDCHAQEKVVMKVETAVSCAACHLELERVTPADHKNAAFRQGHGDAAKTDITTCQQCHLNPGIEGKSAAGPHGMQPVALQVTAAAATNQPPIPKMPPGSIVPAEGVKDACASCHGITMPHPKTWLQSHATGYTEKPELCASCHGNAQTGFSMAYQGNPRNLSTENPKCVSCHVQPVPHPQNWVSQDHQAAAQSQPQTCELCHSANNPVNAKAPHASANFCLDCHMGRYSHPGGWVGNHKFAVAAAGGSQKVAGCTQCHTPTNKSCTECHTNGIGTNQEWHPDGWVATHKLKVNAAGGNQAAAGCTQCHSQETAKEITTCTECHTSGVGSQTKWHPNMWWVSHARYAKPNDTSCARCHDDVEPSCSQCHTKF